MDLFETFPPFAKTNAFTRWYHFNDALESPYTHFFSFQKKLVSQFASTGGFKQTSLDNLLPWRKAVLISIDASSHLFVAIIARVALSVSLLHVGESLGTSWRFSSSNPYATNWALGLLVASGFPLREQIQQSDIHFWWLYGATS